MRILYTSFSKIILIRHILVNTSHTSLSYTAIHFVKKQNDILYYIFDTLFSKIILISTMSI